MFAHLPEKLLESGISVRVRVAGASMFPIIRTGDRITIRHEKSPAVGDIVVFRREDRMVCHRLVRTFEKDGIKYYQTCGDAFYSPDEPIVAEQILGKVTGIDREHISLIRRLFLLLHPVLRYGRLNSAVVAPLARIKRFFLR